MENYDQPGYGYEQTVNTSGYNNQTGYGDNPGTRQGNIVVGNRAKYTLQSISKWLNFLAILGIIGCVILIVFGLGIMAFGGFAGLQDEIGGAIGALGAFVGIIYIILGGIYLYPLIKMLNYASKIKAAIRFDRQDLYEEALSNINSAVTFWGVLTIIGLALFVLSIFFSIIAAIAA